MKFTWKFSASPQTKSQECPRGSAPGKKCVGVEIRGGTRINLNLEDPCVAEGALEPLQEGVSELGERPELHPLVDDERVAGDDHRAAAARYGSVAVACGGGGGAGVGDDVEAVRGRLGPDPRAGVLLAQEVLDERGLTYERLG